MAVRPADDPARRRVVGGVARPTQMRGSAGLNDAEGWHDLQPLRRGWAQPPRRAASPAHPWLPRDGTPPASASPIDALGDCMLQPTGGWPSLCGAVTHGFRYKTRGHRMCARIDFSYIQPTSLVNTNRQRIT